MSVATAEFGDGGVDLGVGRIIIPGDERRRRHDHSRLAKSALRHAFGDPGLLDRMRAVARQRFDSGDEAALGGGDGDREATPRLPVDVYGSGPPTAGAARNIGGGELVEWTRVA